MYCDINFKTKKALKEAVQKYLDGSPHAVTYFQPGPFAGNEPREGKIYVEGPHYPEPHRWYAVCTVKNGVIVHVK